MSDYNEELKAQIKQLFELIESLQVEQSFQEQHIADLNSSLFEQQKQILLLQQENKHLAEQLKKVADEDGSSSHTIIDDPPPHY